MKRLDVTADFVTELENAVAGASADSSLGLSQDPTVGTWDGVDSTETPVALVNYQDHNSLPVGNTNYDGPVKDSTTGNQTGRRLIDFWEAEFELVLRLTHETDSIRLATDVYDHFRIISDTLRKTLGDEYRSMDLDGPYKKTVEHRSPDDVFQQAVAVTVRYIDIVEDTSYEPIESFNNDYNLQN